MSDPSPPAEASVRIVRLVIDELFGPGSSAIDVEFKLDHRVTVLHGRNGSGKTITLKLLEAIREGRFEVLAEYPFKSLRLKLSDGSSLKLEPDTSKDADEEGDETTHWRFRYEIQRSPTSAVLQGMVRHPVENEAQRRQVSARVLRDILKDEHERFVDEAWRAIEAVQDDSSRDRARRPSIHRQTAPELFSLLDRLPGVKFIKADRLFVRKDELQKTSSLTQPELMVSRLSQDIRAQIRVADRLYRLTSTRLDSSLASRLFTAHEELPPLSELEAREQDLHEQTERLLSLGLLRERPAMIDRSELTEDQKKTFFIILEDREKKLEPFASIAAKAQRLLDSLNRKLAPKSVRLDVDAGYQVFSANGDPLPLHCLSSGEQHELVLLHELLFDVQPGSLILVDEPELSLHVTWQVDVLRDLLEIAKLADLDIVLATHSPYIVGDHNELMVRLGEPV